MSTGAIGTRASLRVATDGDAGPLAVLISEAYRVETHFVEGDRIDPEGVRDHLSRGVFLVLPGGERSSGELEACVYLEPRGALGYLGMLSVAPHRQGAGLGHRLLCAGEEWLAHQGCREIEIYVVDQRTELFPWYEKRGYRITGTAPFIDVDRLLRPCCFVVMRKPVGRSEAAGLER
ncbi:MAG TPA: GNAT family N-acetyltransferase [Thermoanaerobaculia bacterium]|nr:GNAT family N-acetyltransferase [Thermoanaerobaculia bacterium]